MLSGAKHLQYLLGTKQMQILREVYPERSERAQDDSPSDFFRSLPELSIIRICYSFCQTHSGRCYNHLLSFQTGGIYGQYSSTSNRS